MAACLRRYGDSIDPVLAGGSDFVTSSKTAAENSLVLQAGIDIADRHHGDRGYRFDGNYSNRGNAQSLKLNFQKQF